MRSTGTPKKFVIISHSFPSSPFHYLTTGIAYYHTDLPVPFLLKVS